MKNRWLKWAFLWCLATLPYNLYGVGMVCFSPPFKSMGFLLGSLLIVSMVVTGFYWLDNMFMKYGYPNFRQYFLQVIGLKFIGTLLGILVWLLEALLLKSDIVFYAVFADIVTTENLYRFLQSHEHETARAMITSSDWYNLLKDLVLVPIFLMVESGCFLISMMVLVLFKDLFWRQIWKQNT